jgi:metal-sulfur cluster biosynthetic enzyme
MNSNLMFAFQNLRAAGAIAGVALVAVLCVNAELWAQNSEAAVQRTDSFERKMELLEDAWKRGDYDLARSLTHSLRDTVLQTQNEAQSPGAPLIETAQFHAVESLPASWREWARGWKYCKTLSVAEPVGEARDSEPVEIALSFPAEQVVSLARELRLARIENDALIEVPCQVFGELHRKSERCCRLLWMTASEPKQTQRFLVFYGNPEAELPEYPSDLKTVGEGVGLDISNGFFKVSLSRQTGQIARLTLRREHGLELYAGGEGHGEPPGIDWAHDYIDAGNFQKLRITLWESCPDYEVVRGPLCTIVRRFGFPHSPVHPVYSPARLHVDVEYRFYCGLPWFHKLGTMKAIQTFEATALRDDEWVFTGQPFTDPLWMDREGKLHVGEVDAAHREDLWGVGFFNRDSKDSFAALFLEHSAEGLGELSHNGAPQMFYRWHGHVWSRYPLPGNTVPAGAVLRQKNAYVAIPFTEDEGRQEIEKLRRCLMHPLVVSGNVELDLSRGQVPKAAPTARLSRPGEAADSPIPKRLIWEALHDTKDGQLYTADVSIVELGLVADVRVRGDVVTVIMTPPHRGRSRIEYFVDGSTSVHATPSFSIRERLLKVPGVRHVVVEPAPDPAWSSNRLTETGRKKLRIE